MPGNHRNLIISPIGTGSVHASWLSHPDERTFDVMLVNYSDRPGFGRDHATHYVERKGFKWELVHHCLVEHRETIERYTNVWLPDCDIRSDTLAVNRLFELFERYALELAQPAIAKGEVTYRALLQKPGVILRFTPFVEVMCPMFTRAALSRVAFSFPESRSGWGLDWVWPRFFEPHQIAIIDEVGVEHTGRLFQGENYAKLAALGVHPGDDLKRMLKRYGGYKRRVQRGLVRGYIRLPEIRVDGSTPSLLERLWSRAISFGWRKTA